MNDWKNIYSKIEWLRLSKVKNKTFLYEIDSKSLSIREYENADRSLLISADSFVTHVINKYNDTGFITKYHIIERILDENNNLVVIVESCGNLDV
ncbi:hypothetical protein [Brevibacillus laterosporus]|uniref:hypothetical protein n=1 Tax=Brevibacillus laterosporus TaxID=1465 RepID=UPI000839B40D|nr:hypothetical protein [Brevibacillus laterosporus]